MKKSTEYLRTDDIYVVAEVIKFDSDTLYVRVEQVFSRYLAVNNLDSLERFNSIAIHPPRLDSAFIVNANRNFDYSIRLLRISKVRLGSYQVAVFPKEVRSSVQEIINNQHNGDRIILRFSNVGRSFSTPNLILPLTKQREDWLYENLQSACPIRLNDRYGKW